ncbi:MAG: glycosyltransferase family 2 protein, partial [Armatimonadota bacterium]|nr:glycosyltransferase family 2 protein [Armatimonadota bacterium]
MNQLASSAMKVSIVMVTYNHEKYIAQAVESVLMQETNFDYELIIGEDCSQDKTRAIVMDFQRRFPERIRLLLPEKNLGGSGKTNFLQTLAAAQGQYVALLEGDDYWTSPHKLQKQVDFLDSHPECAICFHKSNMLYE